MNGLRLGACGAGGGGGGGSGSGSGCLNVWGLPSGLCGGGGGGGTLVWNTGGDFVSKTAALGAS